MNLHKTRKLCMLPVMAVLMGVMTLTSCNDEKDIDFSGLPATAQAFIKQYFPGTEVTRAVRDKDHGTKDYEVTLSDGTELDFDESGTWTKVDCHFSNLPAGILLPTIATHIETTYPDAVAYKVEKELGGYEVSINSGKELIYTGDGTFVREEVDRD